MKTFSIGFVCFAAFLFCGCQMDALLGPKVSISTTPARAGLVNYDPPPKTQTTRYYSVKMGDEDVFVYSTAKTRFAYVSLSSPVRVKVTSDAEISSLDIRPKKLAVQALRTDAHHFEFDLPGPCELSIEVNGSSDGMSGQPPLFVFANPPEVRPSADAAIFFASGKVYDIGDYQVPAGKTIYIEGGAILKGSLNVDGDNVKILGRGIVDARTTGGRVVRVSHCKNVAIDGPIFLNADTWGVVAGNVRNLTLKNIKVINESTESVSPSTPDGVDLLACSNVVADGLFIRSEDDSFCIKNGKYDWNGNSEAITLKNSVLFNGPAGNAMEIGWELPNQFVRNVLYENIDVIHKTAKLPRNDRAAMAIHLCQGSVVSNIDYHGIRVEDAEEGLVNLKIWDRDPNAANPIGHIRDICFRDVSLTGGNAVPSLLKGYDLNHPVENVLFQNLTILGRKILNAEEGGIIHASTQNVRFQ